MFYAAQRIFVLIGFAGVVSVHSIGIAQAQSTDTGSTRPSPGAIDGIRDFLDQHCVDCHGEDGEAGFSVEALPLSIDRIGQDDRAWSDWELVHQRIRGHQMPPAEAYQPEPEARDDFLRVVADRLDRVAAQHASFDPLPIRRFTRSQYENVIRDLLGLRIDASQWLPKDVSSGGFDHITVSSLSPALIGRYVDAAEEIADRAMGLPDAPASTRTIRLPADLTQEHRMDGLPPGTRGGVAFEHAVPSQGTYRLSARLTRDRDERVEGLDGTHHLDVIVGHQVAHRWTIRKPSDGDDTRIDRDLNVDLNLTSGIQSIAVTFADRGRGLKEISRQPFDAAYNRHRHPRTAPAILEVSLIGPLRSEITKAPSIASGNTSPSRTRILIDRPRSGQRDEMLRAAKAVLSPLLRRAYRRGIDDQDWEVPLRFFAGSAGLGVDAIAGDDHQLRFERGLRAALAAILVNPNFLLRAESHSSRATSVPHAVLASRAIASRLSFFLWGSLPDDPLLDLAEAGQLTDRESIVAQVRRMLADPRSSHLTNGFCDQWLHLRNLPGLSPDLRRFPDFDENLRRAMAEETRRLFREVVRGDLPISTLLRPGYTFLNERLATHYGIASVRGPDFRKVALPDDSQRGGLLRHASILAVTSYATRTSPTIRGAWVLENLFGTPPPPPPPNVPTLKEDVATGTPVSLREQLRRHRDDAACASCHALMDPIGFAMDHYDALGRFRDHDGDLEIDSRGTLPDKTEVTSIADLERVLIDHPDRFAHCLTEKLLTFALGRIIDHRDQAAVRQIVDRAAASGDRFSDFVIGVATSAPMLAPLTAHPPSPQ